MFQGGAFSLNLLPERLFMSTPLFLFFNLGGGEIFIILLIVLMLFGAKKIPEFARGLGKGIRQFKDATDNIQRDIQDSVNEVKRDVDINKKLKRDPSNSDKKED